MMQFLPTTQWFSNVACIPIKLPSPTVQPCTSAQCPTVTFSPRVTQPPMSQCSTALSCTLLFLPMVNVPSSPRSTAPYQTVEPGFKTTSPCTVALGATKAAPSSRGVFPQKDKNIVKNHLSLLVLLWYSYK